MKKITLWKSGESDEVSQNRNSDPHLSKGTSDSHKKCEQLLKPFPRGVREKITKVVVVLCKTFQLSLGFLLHFRSMVDKFPLRCACWEKCVVFVGWWNSLTALRAMTHSSLSWRDRSHARTCLTLSQVCSPTQFIIFCSLFYLVFKSDMEPCKVAPCPYCILEWKVTP